MTSRTIEQILRYEIDNQRRSRMYLGAMLVAMALALATTGSVI